MNSDQGSADPQGNNIAVLVGIHDMLDHYELRFMRKYCDPATGVEDEKRMETISVVHVSVDAAKKLCRGLVETFTPFTSELRLASLDCFSDFENEDGD